MRSLLLLFLIVATWVEAAEVRLFLPHFTFKAGLWQTEFQVKNEGLLSSPLSIVAYDDAGNLLAEKTLSLGGGATLGGSLIDVLPEVADTAGSLVLLGENLSLSGHLSFRHQLAGGSTSLPLSRDPARFISMTGLTEREDWESGFAITNTSDSACELVIELIDGEGVVRHQVVRQLSGHGKLVSMTSGLFGDSLPAQYGIQVYADQPVTGLALNFGNGFEQMVAVPADHFPERAPLLVTELDQVKGTWDSVGYGTRFIIGAQSWSEFQLIGESCFKVDEGPAVDFIEGSFLIGEDVLLIYTPYAVAPLLYHRNSADPCNSAGDEGDPVWNFELFWHIFQDYYAFFQLRGVDWEARYETFRPRVTPEMSSDALFDILVEMVADITDAHISIESEERSFSGRFRHGPTADRIYAEAMAADPEFPYRWFVEMLGGMHGTILENYLNEPVIDELARFYHGWLTEDIGYLNIFEMTGFTENGEPVPDAEQLLHAAIQGVVDRFADARVMVVDIRYNFGGSDVLGRTYASYFADQARLGMYKRPRVGAELGPTSSIFLDPPTANGYHTPIVLLTSPTTISAGETFAIMMRALPHVTVLGEATSGALSDILSFNLPNGWEIGLSNEVYYSPDDEVFEQTGVPVDVTVPTWVEADRGSSVDSTLDATLEYIRVNLP